MPLAGQIRQRAGCPNRWIADAAASNSAGIQVRNQSASNKCSALTEIYPVSVCHSRDHPQPCLAALTAWCYPDIIDSVEGPWMQIRPAVESDVPALEHLYQERVALLFQSDRRIAAVPVIWVGRGSGDVWIGEVDRQIGGYVSIQKQDNSWLIDHMAIDMHTYYPGLARALVSQVCAQGPKMGFDRIGIWVPERNPVEQAFWRALGATITNFVAPGGYEWMQLRV